MFNLSFTHQLMLTLQFCAKMFMYAQCLNVEKCIKQMAYIFLNLPCVEGNNNLPHTLPRIALLSEDIL